MSALIWIGIILLSIIVIAGLFYITTILTLTLDEESIEDWEEFGNAIGKGK